MNFIKKLLQKVYLFIQFSLILIYLLLEELIWHNIAEPIVLYFKELKISTKVDKFLQKQNRYVVLIIFLSMFVIAEALGLLSPVFIAKGLAFMGFVLYGIKIVLATFAFWIFNTQKETLLSFTFINYSYEKIIYYLHKIKSSEIYIYTTTKIKNIKSVIKKSYLKFKTYIKQRLFG